MKKLLIFIPVTIVLQVLYYLLFLQNSDASGILSYNLISIISTLFFLGYYIYKSFFILQYDIVRNVQNIVVSIAIVIVMFSLIFYLTFFGNMFTSIYGVAVYQINGYDLLREYSDPSFGNFIEFHLIRLQFSLIILYIFMELILQRNRFKVRRFKKYYKITTVFVLFGFFTLLITNFGFFYYYNFLFNSSLIYWLAIPIFYNISSQFHHYYGVMIGWLLTVVLFWYMIDEFFSTYRMVAGYIFGQ